MSNRHGWLILVTLTALLLAACGPQMATPTAGVGQPTGSVATTETVATISETEGALPAGSLPVDPDNWRALGAPDAPVTIIEYSDFQ